MKLGSASGVLLKGCAAAGAVSRRFPTATVQVQSQVRSCGICGRQSGTGTSFLRVIVSPTNFHSITSSIFRGWYNRPNCGLRGRTRRRSTPRIVKPYYKSCGFCKAVIIRIVVLCVLTPCSVAGGWRRFEGSCCHYLQGRNTFHEDVMTLLSQITRKRDTQVYGQGRKFEIRPGNLSG
jgi:hypothetical protein